MDDQALTPLDVAARVVAWHNRHPLARRIDVKDVHSLGVVALPWSTAGTTDLPPSRLDRLKAPLRAWIAKLRRKPPEVDTVPSAVAPALRPAFSEDFIPGTPTARIAAFVRRYGREDSPAPDHWPMRQVRSDADVTDTWLYVLTAAIGTDEKRPRLLLSSEPRVTVLGRRTWDRRRALAAGLATLILLGGGVGLGARLRSHGVAPGTAPISAAAASAAAVPTSAVAPPPAASAAASAALASANEEAASAPEAGASAPTVNVAASAAEAVHAPASALPPDSIASAPEQAPVEASRQPSSRADQPSPARPEPTPREHRPAGRSGQPASPPPSPPAASSISEFLTQDRPDDARARASRYFALMSRGARSRAAAEALLPKVQDAARTIDVDPADRNVHIEVIQAKGGWHAVWWPFSDQRSATEARWALALKGVTVDLVDF